MKTYWPLSIVGHGLGLNITVMSYAGAMGFGFTTARSAVPDARELSAALLAALDELVASSHIAPVGRARSKAVSKKAPGAPASARPGATPRRVRAAQTGAVSRRRRAPP